MAGAALPRGAIYAIVNLETGRYYVGSAADYRARWRQHRSQLSRGAHVNRHLQASYNKHGAGAFVYMTLECVTDRSALLAREQFYLDRMRPHLRGVGYNQYLKAGSPAGTKLSEETKRRIGAGNVGKIFTEERRARISAALTGKRLSAEHKEKVRRANLGRKDSPETAAKKAAVLRKHCVLSDEAIKRRVESWHANPVNKQRAQEQAERLRIANIGKRLSPESIRKRTETCAARLAEILALGLPSPYRKTPEAIAKHKATCAAKRALRG